MATEKQLQLQESLNKAQNISITNNTKILGQTKSLTKLIADQVGKVKELGDSQEEVIGNFSEFSQQVKNFKGYASEVIKLSQSFDGLNNQVEEVESSLKNIGIESTKFLTNLREETIKNNSSFKKLISTLKETDKVKGSIEGISNNLKRMGELQKGANDDTATKSLKESFKSLQAYLNPDELAKYMEVADKITPKNFQKSVEELNSLHLKDLKKNLQDLSAADAFDKLDKESQQKVKDFLEMNNFDPTTMNSTIDEIVNIMGKAHQKMNTEASAEMIKLQKEYEESKKKAEDYKESINKKMVFNIDINEAKKDTENLTNSINRALADGFVLDDILKNQQEVYANQTSIESISEKLKKITEEIASEEASGAKASNEKYKYLRKTQKELSTHLKLQQKITEETQEYLDTVEKVKDNPLGSDKAKELAGKFTNVAARLQTMGEKGGIFGKTMQSASGIIRQMGVNLKGAGIYLGMLSASVAVMKKVLSLQSDVAKRYAGLKDVGVFSGGGDIAKNLSTSLDKFRNEAGLKKAVMGGDAFALDFEDIKESVGALDQAGIKASKLNSIMQDITTTSVANGNEFLKASDMVQMYSTNLGVSKGEVASLMGDMYLNYNKNFKNINESLLKITESAQKSSVGANRFLATVQTVTSGLSLYEDQVADTAQALIRMTEGLKMTNKQAEMAAKGANDFAKNTDLAMKNLAMLDSQQLDALKEQAKEKAKKILGGKKESELKGADKSRYDAYKQFIEGDAFAMGSTLEFLDQGIINKSFGMVLDSLKDQATRGGKIDFGVLKKLAVGRGLDPALISEEIRSGFKMAEGLQSKPEDVKLTQAKVIQNALEVDRKAGDANNKLMRTIVDAIKDRVFDISNTLLVIASLVGVFGGLGTLIKLFSGIGPALKVASLGIAGIAKVLLPLLGALGLGAGIGMGINALDEKYLGGAVGNAVQSGFDKISRFFGGDGIVTDEEAFKKAEENFKKPDYKNKPENVIQKALDLDKQLGPTLSPKNIEIPSIDLANLSTSDMLNSLSPTPSVASTGSVVININGGDIDQIRRVVQDELSKATSLSKRV